VAFTDKIYVKNHRNNASQLETNIPKGAFAGATLDMLFTGDGLSKLDSTTQDRILDFAEDFLDCDCQANPYCGCAEEKFMRYVLELRAEGLGPQAIVDVMSDDYMVYAYTGDVLSFLDNSVRQLEASRPSPTSRATRKCRSERGERSGNCRGEERSSSLFVMCATFSERRSSIYK